jgi:hypothetical protein
VAQTPEELARLIQTILEDPNPRFRYQSSDGAADFVSTKLVDLTGEKVGKVMDSWLIA